jgi:two-component sensor histidine kinase
MPANMGHSQALTAVSRWSGVSIPLGRAQKTFTITWHESGGPPVAAPKRQGFGSTVITDLAEMNLGAKAELVFASSGLRWRLSCEAGDVLDGSNPPDL